MCNLYNVTKGSQAILQAGDVYPDYLAPVVRTGSDGVRELVRARWGMPSSQKAIMDAASKRADKLRAKGKEVDFNALLKVEPDAGTTNIRNVKSAHWTRWLGTANRCLVPANAFSEYGNIQDALGKLPIHWFALDDDQPLFCFAGLWTRWQGVRRAKEGLIEADIFAFLTTEPNGIVAPIHPKAMPVILTTAEEMETWLAAPAEKAMKLQRPLPDDRLKLINRLPAPP